MTAEQTYGLLGRNISYSLSPTMHNAAFGHFGIPAVYKLFDMEEKELGTFFRDRVLGGGIKGFNVTVPYKIRIREMLEAQSESSLDKDAKILGAVNTVKIEKEGLFGFNTDGEGFLQSLQEDAGFDPKGRTVFVLGAGGAGRAICIYLASGRMTRPEKINVHDIDREKISELEKVFGENFGAGLLETVVEKDIPGRVGESDLLVNATPLGTKEGDPLPADPDHLKKGVTVYDLVYARETELVKAAKEKGLVAVNGLGMLVNQGALAFCIWTGKPRAETKKVMEDVLMKEMGR